MTEPWMSGLKCCQKIYGVANGTSRRYITGSERFLFMLLRI